MTAQSFSDRSSLGLAYVAAEEVGGICSDAKEVGFWGKISEFGYFCSKNCKKLQ